MADGDKIPRLPSERMAWFNSLLQPVNDFYLWCRTVDSRIRAGAAASASLEKTIGALTIGDSWAHTVTRTVNGTYFLCVAKTAGKIDSTYTKCTSGTCTVRWRINGTNVGTAANSVSTVGQEQTHTTANEFEAGDVIDYVISSSSSCLGALLQCSVTRSLV